MARNPSLYLSTTEEWYTPAPYIAAAHAVLGEIELDPASCAVANEMIKAKTFYSKEQDGLAKPWKARTMWLNPPYGRLPGSRTKGQVELWIEKLLDSYREREVGEALLLVNCMPYKRWFDPLWEYPLCFISKRLAFYNEFGVGGRSPHASVIAYLGENEQGFIRHFSQFGPIVDRIG